MPLRLCVLSFRFFLAIRETASCPVRELAIRELANPRVVQLKPNSITLASLELAPNMFEAGSCQIPIH